MSEPTPFDSRGMIGVLAKSPVALWIAFILTHVLLSFQSLNEPGSVLADIGLYDIWSKQVYDHTSYVGIDQPWVYPIVAIVPMLVAGIFGTTSFVYTWLGLVFVLDALAFFVVVGWGRRPLRLAIGWWWTGFLLFLGPIALDRLDAVSVSIAIVGVLYLASRPRLAALLVTVATWIKVWPAALIAATLIATKSRLAIFVTVVIASAVIVVTALALGAGANVFSFVGDQTSRGLQVEAPVSTTWMWLAFANVHHSEVVFDHLLSSWEIVGPGATTAAAVLTPVLALAVAIVGALGIIASRRGAGPTELLAPLSVALVTAFIVFNKVGSPQYMTWIAVPVILGLVTRSTTGGGTSFRFPAALALAIAACTQLFYPELYPNLLELQLPELIELSVRNILVLVLFGWSVVVLVKLCRAPAAAAAALLDLAPQPATVTRPLDTTP